MKSVCDGCAYFKVCGDPERTMPCNGIKSHIVDRVNELREQYKANMQKHLEKMEKLFDELEELL